MADIIFHKYLLYIGKNQLKQEDCAKVADFSKNLKDHLFQYDKMPHELYVNDDKSNSCIWIYIKSGNSLPYDDNVIDVETNEKTMNPRQITQVELRQQIFALYDYKKQSFYISNTKSISILTSFFNQALNTHDITIKKILKDFNDVLKSFKSIKSIRLIARNNLFTQTDNLFKTITDSFGLGVPGQYRIDVNFEYATLTDSAIGKLKELNSKRLGADLDGFICVGRDDGGLESVFNMDTFISQISVKAAHNEKGMYSDIEVKFVVAVIAYFCKFEIDGQLTSDLLTIMSIILGFTLTSISTLVGQEFSKKLHRKIDSDTSRKQTQLQTLAIYYKNSFLLGISVIILLILLRFIINCNAKRIMSCIILGLSADNLLLSFLLLKVLIRSLLETE